MPDGRPPQPSSWADYERGGRESSLDSQLSHNRIQFDEEAQRARVGESSGLQPPSGQQNARRRRSSLSMRISSIAQAGGVNSLDNFARSWQRASTFHTINPQRASFRYTSEDAGDYEEGEEEEAPVPRVQGARGLFRSQYEDRRFSEDALDDDDDTTPNALSKATTTASTASATLRPTESQPLLQERLSRVRDDRTSFFIEPSLASPFGGSYGTRYGSIVSKSNEPSMRHAARIFREQQQPGKAEVEGDSEEEPILVKQIQEEDGKIVNVVVGRSTLPQTVLNMVNVLIGIGLLALPLAFEYSGWIPGILFLLFAVASTNYTAKLLAKCLDVDNSLLNFADLAYVSFGSKARVMTSLLFTLELLATCVALVVLFADSLDALIPGWGLTEWKLVCGIILLPLGFLPLRLLSFTSILGIICCFGIVIAIFLDGLVKPHQPGSLRDPAITHIWPENWMTLPLSFGLLMSPWGGHSVFPNIYRDMRHPYKYRRAVDITYVFSFLPDVFMAAVGIIMFGDEVKDEISRNVLTTEGYPRWINLFIVVCVAIIPLTKVPLNSQPIVGTAEMFLSLDPISIAKAEETKTGFSPFARRMSKIVVRVVVVIIFVGLAILVPDFDRIMSLLGAIACFTVCIILPIAFHLKLFGKELTRFQKARDWLLLIISAILALVSTAFNFVPKEKLGMK